MRHIFFYIALALCAISPDLAMANTLTASVKGMDCAFCAKELKTQIQKDKAVANVKITIDNGTVTVTAKPGKTVSENTIRKAVDFMGYKLVTIKNTP